MVLDINQAIGGSPMSGLSALHFSPLYDTDITAAQAATWSWNTLLDGETTPYMQDTAEFYKRMVYPT